VDQQDKTERQRNKPPKESVTDENMERICTKFNLK
jgi:hypothetical protein